MGTISQVKKRKDRFYFEEVYNARIFFSVGGTVEEIKNYLIRRHGFYPEEVSDTDCGFAWEAVEIGTTKLAYYLWLEKFDSSNLKDRADLVHEIDHLANYILHGAGLKFSADSEEGFSYYKEHLYEKFVERFGRKK